MREKKTGPVQPQVVLGVHTQLAKAVYQIHAFITSHFMKTTKQKKKSEKVQEK